MKKASKIALLCICISGFAFAGDKNPFQSRKNNRPIPKELELDKLTKQANNFQNVPTMIKNYGWSDSLMNWEGTSREEYTYNNDRIVSIYNYNIDRTDTFGKGSNTYDANGYLTFYYYENYLGNGEYQPQTRMFYEYTNNYKKVTITTEFYNFVVSAWVPVNRFSQEKINNGETSRIVNFFYTPGGWTEISGYSYTIRRLNSNSSKISEYVDSILNTNLGMYEFYAKESRVYDANENAIAIVYTENVNGTVKTTEIDSIYYVNNVPSELVIAVVDFGAPKKIYKYSNLVWQNYNTNKDINENRLTDHVGYTYFGNSWRLNDRSSTTFLDVFGSTILLNEEYRSNNWVPVDRSTQRFNFRGYKILDKFEQYDVNASKWNINTADSSTLTYDANNNITSLAKSRYNPLLTSWENTTKQEYFDYITISTGLNTSKNTLEAKLYPNPSSNGTVFVNVNSEAASTLNIKITDMKGSVVYTDESNVGRGLNTIELNGLQHGLYMVVLSSEYGVARAKLIVQ